MDVEIPVIRESNREEFLYEAKVDTVSIKHPMYSSQSHVPLRTLAITLDHPKPSGSSRQIPLFTDCAFFEHRCKPPLLCLVDSSLFDGTFVDESHCTLVIVDGT